MSGVIPTLWIWNPATGQFESHSALFDGAENISFTPASAASDLTKMTFVMDMKLTKNQAGGLFGVGSTDAVYLDSGLYPRVFLGGGGAASVTASESLQDLAHFGQLYVGIDTTQVTASDRIVIKWNNVALTLSGSYPAQNYNLVGFCKALAHYLGMGNGSQYTKFYCSEMAFLPGVIESSDSFYDADTNSMKDLTSLNPEHWLRFVKSEIDNSGSAIGNLTTGSGGLDAAFDGVDSGSQSSINTAYGANVSPAAEIGRNWSESKTVYGYRIKAPSNIGFQYQGRTLTVKLRGSNDGSSWTDLHSDTFVDAIALEKIYTSGIDTSTSYTHHQAWIQYDTSGRDYQVAELELYTVESPSINLGANSGSEGDWTVNGTVEHTSDSPENNVMTFDPARGTTIPTFGDGNRISTTNGRSHVGAFPLSSGKWRCEFTTATAGAGGVGITQANGGSFLYTWDDNGDSHVIDGFSFRRWDSGSIVETLPGSGGANDIWALELDLENDTCEWFVNDTSIKQISITPSGTWWMFCDGGGSSKWRIIASEADWTYAASAEDFLSIEGKNDATFNTPATVT